MSRAVTLAIGEPGGGSPARSLPDNAPCLVIRTAPASGARGRAPWSHQGRGYVLFPRLVLEDLRGDNWTSAVHAWRNAPTGATAFDGARASLFGRDLGEGIGGASTAEFRDVTLVTLASVPARSHVLVWMNPAPTWARGGGSDAGWVPAVVEASPSLDVEDPDGDPLTVAIELFLMNEYRPPVEDLENGIFVAGGFQSGGIPARFGTMPRLTPYGLLVAVPARVRSFLPSIESSELGLRWEPAATGVGLLDVPASGFGFASDLARTTGNHPDARTQARLTHGRMFGL